MKLTEKAAAMEAVLFACGDPVEPEKLAVSVGVDKGALSQLADSLNESYAQNGSSLTVLRLSGSYQIAVRAEYSGNVELAMENRKNTPLSPAAMEALTIIAYNQPVTKSFVENIRGVDSSGVVNSLVEKNLLEEAGRLDVPGRPIAYRTTPVFLRCFGLSSLDELPELPGHICGDFSPVPAEDGETEDGEDSS
ncbi:MAG: SMC-Scp complex subunit ScpB [Ruminococcus sp.]|nr:SMC-Scp complex subunit ScpB [Ruminococcus sp.]